MIKAVAVLLYFAPAVCFAQGIGSTYTTRDGRADTVVIACPSADGSYTAIACPTGTGTSSGGSSSGPVTYQAPVASGVATANVAVTVFPAGSVITGCDVVNSGSGVLYVDLTATAVIGSDTSVPLQPGQSFHCPYPPAGAMSAIAAQPQPFVAIRY